MTDTVEALQARVQQLERELETFRRRDDDEEDKIDALRNTLAAAEVRESALREVLLELAPFVAVLSRAPEVSPSGRKSLLATEPKMLAALSARAVPK